MIEWARALVRRRSTTAILVFFALLSAATGAFSLYQLRSAARDARQLSDDLVSGLDLIAALQFDVQEARRRMLYALTTTDANLQVQYVDESRAADARIAQRVGEHLRRLTLPADRAAARQFARDWVQYLNVRDEVIASILEGQTQVAVERDLHVATPAFDRARADLLAMQNRYKTDAVLRRDDIEYASNRSYETVVVVLLLTQLLAMVGLRMAQRGELLTRERRSQARLFEVIESIDEGMFVLGREGQVVIWNAAAERLSGRPRDKVLGQPLWLAWPRLARTALGGTLASSLTEPGTGTTRLSVHLSDVEGERILDVRTFPFEDGVTVFFTDITNL
ncbi:MAG TPA: PAS domain-containing protein, partial [Gemmatimonadaceae bacterium]